MQKNSSFQRIQTIQSLTHAIRSFIHKEQYVSWKYPQLFLFFLESMIKIQKKTRPIQQLVPIRLSIGFIYLCHKNCCIELHHICTGVHREGIKMKLWMKWNKSNQRSSNLTILLKNETVHMICYYSSSSFQIFYYCFH